MTLFLLHLARGRLLINFAFFVNLLATRVLASEHNPQRLEIFKFLYGKITFLNFLLKNPRKLILYHFFRLISIKIFEKYLINI